MDVNTISETYEGDAKVVANMEPDQVKEYEDYEAKKAVRRVKTGRNEGIRAGAEKTQDGSCGCSEEL